jgi:hypothetical protein
MPKFKKEFFDCILINLAKINIKMSIDRSTYRLTPDSVRSRILTRAELEFNKGHFNILAG